VSRSAKNVARALLLLLLALERQVVGGALLSPSTNVTSEHQSMVPATEEYFELPSEYNAYLADQRSLGPLPGTFASLLTVQGLDDTDGFYSASCAALKGRTFFVYGDSTLRYFWQNVVGTCSSQSL